MCSDLIVTMAEGSRRVLSVSFEVFGKVQGVFFRKHTKVNADKHRLVGWVMNTAKGTVVGELQGPEDKVKQMMTWLQKTGSPKSKIDKCEFAKQKTVEKCSFKTFDIVKEGKRKT